MNKPTISIETATIEKSAGVYLAVVYRQKGAATRLFKQERQIERRVYLRIAEQFHSVMPNIARIIHFSLAPGLSHQIHKQS